MEKELDKLQEKQLEEVAGGVDAKHMPSKEVSAKAYYAKEVRAKNVKGNKEKNNINMYKD